VKVTYRCDQCSTTTDNENPFDPTKIPHWVTINDHDFCSATCATAFWVEPAKASIGIAVSWLDRATRQLDHCPDAASGDRRDVQMSSRAAGHVSEAVRILDQVLDLMAHRSRGGG
jgi:hypothetical protein